MTNYRTREPYYKAARRAFRKLLSKHSNDLLEEALFIDADASICPELYSGPEQNFACCGSPLAEELFLHVADDFGLDPCLLDDMVWEADHIQEDRMMDAIVAARRPHPG